MFQNEAKTEINYRTKQNWFDKLHFLSSRIGGKVLLLFLVHDYYYCFLQVRGGSAGVIETLVGVAKPISIV